MHTSDTPSWVGLLHRQGFLTLLCEKGCSVHGPGHMTSISRFTSRYKIAAPATAITSAFPPTRRQRRKDQVHFPLRGYTLTLGHCLAKTLSYSHI